MYNNYNNYYIAYRGGSTGVAGRAIAPPLGFYLYENLFENYKEYILVTCLHT